MTAADRIDLDPARVRRWRNAIIAAFALGGVTLTAFGTRLPSIQSSLAVSKGVIGTALMAITIAALAGLGVAAWVHAVIGARRGLLGALWIAAAGIATVGLGADLARSLPITVVGLAAIGFGIGLLDVLINVEGSALEVAAGRSLMPMLHASWSAGAIIGAGIGAAAAALTVRVGWQFGVEAVVIAAAAVWVAATVPHHPDRAPAEDEGAAVAAHPAPSLVERLRRWARGWTNTRLLLIGLVMLGAELGEGSANTWLTLASRDSHGYSDGAAAAFFVLFAAGETLARAGASPVVDRFGRTVVVRATTLLGVLGVVLFVAFDAAWILAVAVVLWAVGVSMGFPLGMSAAAEAGARPAQQVSVVAAIGYGANLAGPPALGAIADVVGLLRALWVVAALLALACVLAPAVRNAAVAPTASAHRQRRAADGCPADDARRHSAGA